MNGERLQRPLREGQTRALAEIERLLDESAPPYLDRAKCSAASADDHVVVRIEHRESPVCRLTVALEPEQGIVVWSGGSRALAIADLAGLASTLTALLHGDDEIAVRRALGKVLETRTVLWPDDPTRRWSGTLRVRGWARLLRWATLDRRRATVRLSFFAAEPAYAPAPAGGRWRR